MADLEQNIFDKVFLDYHPLLFSFGKRLVQNEAIIEDSIQELFIYIYEKKIDLNEVNNLKAYLFKSFRRLLLKKNNSESKLNKVDPESDIKFVSTEFSGYNNEKSERIVEMLNELPWSQREAVYLKYFNKLSSKQIAEIMNIQPQVVSNTIYKAIKKLKNLSV